MSYWFHHQPRRHTGISLFHEPVSPPLSPWRRWLHKVIYEAETPLGRAFDIVLILAIIASVVAVCLETVQPFAERHAAWLYVAEWGFTLLFTLEYGLRLVSVRRPLAYARSFFGVVDLLAILPTYLSVLVPGSQTLLVIRALRLLRIFRVFKLSRYVSEAHVLEMALRSSSAKIVVFLGTVLTIALIAGAVMYFIEGHGASDFQSIPHGMYWAIVTITTVGYGDVVPQTPVGQFIAAGLMILGYSVIAVPTGIVSVELAEASRRPRVSTVACPDCSAEGHDADARYCRICGAELLHPDEGEAAGGQGVEHQARNR